ncbi:MAG: glycosyltransferase family 2 protein [Anaerolineae bacterium]|nr:glycosyltransferase family 2 protein [Anaerolineae bacterium]
MFMLEQRPFISIIIPHFNDSERLACCLHALENQTYPTERYEIIVVDNGSDEPPLSVISQHPHSQLVVETKPGSYAARNKGLTMAKGEVIAFTDSDCLPQVDWLEKGENALLHHDNIGVVAGQVNLFAADPNAPTVAEIYEQLSAFPIENFVKFWHFGVTANLFTRRKLIEAVGEFNSTLKSGGDLEWGRRVYAAGYEIFYGADVIVNHPALNNTKAIYSKKRRVHGGYHDLLVEQKKPYHYLWRDFPKDILPPVRRSREFLSNSQFSLSTRLQLVKIEWVCNYSVVFERLRLLCGGRSKRV